VLALAFLLQILGGVFDEEVSALTGAEVIGPSFVLDLGFLFARHQLRAAHRIAFHAQPPSCMLLKFYQPASRLPRAR